MRRQGRTREITVGVTLMLALVIVSALILMLGQESRIFRPRRTYTTSVTNSIGLKAGSPVVMGGVQIGTVKDVSLQADPKSYGITAALGVDRAYAPRVRGGSIASVGYITLLSGEKYVNISPGDPEKPELPDGSEIPPDTSETLFQTGQNVAENLATVTGQLREILASINEGEGLVGQIVKSRDPYFGKQTVEHIDATFEKTSRVLDSIQHGQGVVGQLIEDRDYARETLGSVKSAAGRLDHVLELVESRQGAIGDLLSDEGKGRQLLTDLRDASASLKSVASRLESKTGLLGRLLNDAEYSEAVARNFREITTSLSSILAKIDRGDGSAGAFLNDRSVYDGLEDIVGGIKGSGLAKRALRHYAKKGARKRGEGEEPAPPPSPPPQ